jgi:hypothetical protein
VVFTSTSDSFVFIPPLEGGRGGGDRARGFGEVGSVRREGEISIHRTSSSASTERVIGYYFVNFKNPVTQKPVLS